MGIGGVEATLGLEGAAGAAASTPGVPPCPFFPRPSPGPWSAPGLDAAASAATAPAVPAAPAAKAACCCWLP